MQTVDLMRVVQALGSMGGTVWYDENNRVCIDWDNLPGFRPAPLIFDVMETHVPLADILDQLESAGVDLQVLQTLLDA